MAHDGSFSSAEGRLDDWRLNFVRANEGSPAREELTQHAFIIEVDGAHAGPMATSCGHAAVTRSGRSRPELMAVGMTDMAASPVGSASSRSLGNRSLS